MLWLLKTDASTPPVPARGTADEGAPREARAIRCKACGAPVTTHADKISVHGAHEHRRVNPSGVDFVLGCFRAAPGCVAEGTPTLFWTWFPGYAWSIASCAACGAHLGWAFSGEGSFFGLILRSLLD